MKERDIRVIGRIKKDRSKVGVGAMENMVLKRNKNMVSRAIGAETILLPICKDTSQTNCIYTLNKAAARVWELIDGKRGLDQIKNVIAKEFSATEKELDKQMAALLKDLKEIKAVN